MKTFIVHIDDRFDENINKLKEAMGKISQAETFRLAIDLLKIAVDAKADNLKLTLADSNNNVKQEIIIHQYGWRIL